MMLATGKALLREAQKRKYAVGAFNVYNIETLQAVLRAAEKMKSPVIVQTSEAAIEYAGFDALVALVLEESRRVKIPVAFHLDHGKDLKVIRKCIEKGYTSVMFDGSQLPYEENVKKTKQVVEWAHKKGVSVEAELGTIGGKEDKISGGIEFTDPWQAAEFVKRTRCNSLAIGIGTSHGPFKVQAKHLRLDILKEVVKRVSVPIVLHGASLVDSKIVKKARESGMKIEKAQGVNPKDIKKAIGAGVCKVNVDTDLRLAFTTALREFANKHPEAMNPRDLLSSAEKSAEESVARHIVLFCSKGKA